MTSCSSLRWTQQLLQKGRSEIITSMAVTNSLKVGVVNQQITIFYEPINTNLQWKRSGFFLSPDTSQKFGFTYFQNKTLTSPSEGLWLANPSLLWLSYLLLQDSLTTFRLTTPEIFSPLISEELSIMILFSRPGWFCDHPNSNVELPVWIMSLVHIVIACNEMYDDNIS